MVSFRIFDGKKMLYTIEENAMIGTGIPDIENKEAFVDDIVEFGIGFDEKGIIIQHKGFFYIQPMDSYAPKTLLDTAFRIIGNKYETPEKMGEIRG